MTTRRDAIARQTSAWLFTLSEDENRVIANVVDRVRKAVPQYGHLDIRTDKRDWQSEAGAEILDFLFYVGAEWLKQRLARVDAIDSASARADVSHGIPQAGGGTFSCDAQTGCGCYIVHGLYRKCLCGCHSVPSHPSNGSQRVGGVSALGHCQCSHEPGDSLCDVHPTCEGCGIDVAATTSFSMPPWRRLCCSCFTKQMINAGLRELAAATPVKAAAPGILLDFDMSDIGDDE